MSLELGVPTVSGLPQSKTPIHATTDWGPSTVQHSLSVVVPSTFGLAPTF